MFKKISNKNDNTMYFNSDEEFYQFCVYPQLVPVEYIDSTGKTSYYTDFNFTNAYNDAVRKGMNFVIKDENSQIYKHGAVSYRTITKPIKNLKSYYGEFKHHGN